MCFPHFKPLKIRVVPGFSPICPGGFRCPSPVKATETLSKARGLAHFLSGAKIFCDIKRPQGNLDDPHIGFHICFFDITSVSLKSNYEMESYKCIKYHVHHMNIMNMMNIMKCDESYVPVESPKYPVMYIMYIYVHIYIYI